VRYGAILLYGAMLLSTELAPLLVDEDDMVYLHVIFNISKCNGVSFGRSVDKSYMYSVSYNNQTALLDRKDSFKDLGVVMDENLTFRDHMHDKINKAYAMFGIINFFLII